LIRCGKAIRLDKIGQSAKVKEKSRSGEAEKGTINKEVYFYKNFCSIGTSFALQIAEIVTTYHE
jgi:hypothetical protein